MAETLTRGEAQVVINDLKAEATRVGALIKSEGIGAAALGLLKEKQMLVQEKINSILKKGGLITEEDYNDAYNIIKDEKKKQLSDMQMGATTKFWIYVGVAALLVGYGIYYSRKK